MHRTIRVFQDNKYDRDVIQLMARSPSGDEDYRKILRDILHETLHHCSSRSEPIVVHCSTGVGVTGVFIALFKLRDDFYNRL